MLEEFDRVVFESVVEIIIIGGYNDEEVEDSLLALAQLGALAVYKHYRENKAGLLNMGFSRPIGNCMRQLGFVLISRKITSEKLWFWLKKNF